MLKNKLRIVFDYFTKIATIIFICSSIYISIFFKLNSILDVSYIWGVLGIAFILSALRIPIIGDKEPSKKALLIYNILYVLAANILTLAVGFILHWFSLQYIGTVIGMEITILTVTAILWILQYISDKHSAEKMNDLLKKRQKNEVL